MKKAVSAVAVGTLALLACKNPSDTEQTVVLPIEKIEAPAMIAASSPLDVVLTVTTGGCVTFDKIRVQRGPGSVSLTAFGTDSRRDGCLDIAVVGPQTVRLEPPFNPGTLIITVNREGRPPLVTAVNVQ
jgi:hypothetical protein